MNVSIQPKKSIKEVITVPGDKSISHRAVMIGSIAQGKTQISNFLLGGDCLSTIACFRQLGVSIEIASNKQEVIVQGKGMRGLRESSSILDAGNSGTTVRLISGILSGQYFECTITGDESLQKRPMKRIILPLLQMGAEITAKKNNEYLPLIIQGKRLKSIEYVMPIASAQVKSCILLAAQYAEGITTITECDKSRDHTEQMLKAFGGDIIISGSSIKVNPVKQLEGQRVQVPGDISSAAFFIVAAILCQNSEITIKDVGINPTRTGILDVLIDMGADIKIENKRYFGNELVGDITAYSSCLKSTTIQGNIIPRLIDEIPILAVAAVFAEGTTIIQDAQELKVKESNRIAALVQVLNNMGADMEETHDGLIIHGNKRLKGCTLEDISDHRIIMATAIAALVAESDTYIKQAEWTEISFPGFWELLHSL